MREFYLQNDIDILQIIDIIVEMGSISCILVWGCMSLTAFRLYVW